jgi:hypothetical protein
MALAKNDDVETQIRTMAHEMVHVRQFVRKELDEDMTRWKSRRVNMDIIFDINETVCPDNINEILEAAWEYISYRIKGTKIPSSENYIKEIKPIKLKRII